MPKFLEKPHIIQNVDYKHDTIHLLLKPILKRVKLTLFSAGIPILIMSHFDSHLIQNVLISSEYLLKARDNLCGYDEHDNEVNDLGNPLSQEF